MTAPRTAALQTRIFFLPVLALLLAAASSGSAQSLNSRALPGEALPAVQSAGPAQPKPPSTQPSQPASSASQQTPPESREEQQRRAAEELKREEKQRILGVVPNFNTTNDQNAAPLSPKQKLDLDLRSSVDPFVFVFAGLDAAEEQADNDFPGYGQGAQGYGKRFGASYADTFDGNLWGNVLLPIWLREDPRYFRKGAGSFWNRALYSAATNVWSRRDNGTWGPNYANVGGNFIAGGISNLYYPSTDRGFSLTVTRALTVTAEGAIGSEFVEFWPDISQRLFHRKDRIPVSHPTVQPESSKPVQQAPLPPGTKNP